MGGAKAACACSALGDFAVVGMGDSEGRDKRILATLEPMFDHGGEQWWLYTSRCSVCETDWMIAQEERIHDNYYLRRLSATDMQAILENGQWPSEFLRFEDVIKLGPDNNQVARFFNPNDLTDTVKELIEARAGIAASEIAYLLCLSESEAARLIERAKQMSWAQLRPFA